MAAVAIVALLLVRHKPTAMPHASRVAVLPFENTGPDSLAYLVDGLSEALITRLTRDAGIALVPWMTASRYKNTDKSLRDLAVELGVQRLITGTVRTEGAQISVSIGMVNGTTGLQDWAERVDVVSLQSADLESDLARRIAEHLGARLTPAVQQALAKATTRSTEARDWYWKGKAAMDREGPEANASALPCFDRAIALDPAFADAHVGRGAALTSRMFHGWMKEDPAQAEASFHTALRMDSTSVAAYRGLIHLSWFRGDWEGCLKIGRRVSILGLDSPEALFARGEAYCFGGLADRAVPIFQTIVAADPANAGGYWLLVLATSVAGQFDQCVAAGETYAQRFGADLEVELGMAQSYECLGDTLQARIHYNNVMRTLPASVNNYHYAAVARFLETTGHHARAVEILQRGLTSLTREDRPGGSHWAMEYYVLLHDYRGFNTWVQHATGGDLAIACGYAQLSEMTLAREYLRRALKHEVEPWSQSRVCMDSVQFPLMVHEPLWQEYIARGVQTRERALAEY